MNRLSTIWTLIFAIAALPSAFGQLPDGLKDTQADQASPPTPEQALKQITVPPGFDVTLFAGDPVVAQPIAINYDDRGRLWVAESFSYIEWKRKSQDRILIFEDRDGDGRYDSRKVFWASANHLSGFQIGHGGVWICDAPQLLFIPDADRDDIPDGEPEVMLDGWALDAEHNFFNGLTWGPDGWLYGRHGIKKPSLVGRPGTPQNERIELSCAIWRFHPQRHDFEVVADGTINPWGLDWNAEGQAFITTSVVDHLWHLVPGARFARWENRKGGHPNPYSYELMKAASDHRHWEGGEAERRELGHDEQGGGHSHCGLMIYQSDSWPKEFANAAFFNNVHGHRMNMDHLIRKHSGYVATHGPDFLRGNSDWFRGVEVIQSPDGGAMLAEWTDLGECHDRDGIHRTSGRLFKISHGKPQRQKPFDLNAKASVELVELLWHENVWWRRHSLRILQERITSGEPPKPAVTELLTRKATQGSIRDGVIAVQLLALIDRAALRSVYADCAAGREAVRAQVIHLLFHERKPTREDVLWLVRQVKGASQNSSLVDLHMASALQRVPVEDRWELATALAQRPVHPDDRNLALMIWYGFEPLVPLDRTRALKISLGSKIPLIRQFTARRIAAGR
jgi:putative membrane-bound dehydrogenase-like protein